MQQENISYLLKELSIVRMKYKVLYEQREQFNIFSVLHKEQDERRLHSRFIAALLNPEGSHKKDKKFLFLFLNALNIEHHDFETAEVYPKEGDKKEYKDIDILIIDRKSRKAIIIENKIYARDSNRENDGQLERYFNRVKDEENIPKKAITTLYLTLDGHEPSDESFGGYKNLESINGQCIAYTDFIIKWLDSCIKEVTNLPYLRESISQYKSLIEKMTGNQTDSEHSKDIRDTIAKNEDSMKAAKELIDNFKHVKFHTIKEFWSELSDEIKKLGYKVTESPTDTNITDITHYAFYRKGQKEKQKCGVYFKVCDGFIINIYHNANDELFYACDNEDVANNYKEAIKQLVKEDNSYHREDEIAVWKYFLSNDEDRIILNNFEHEATFQLINPDNRRIVITNICEEIKEFIKKVEDKMNNKSR